MAKTFGMLFGIVFLAVGILGFLSGGISSLRVFGCFFLRLGCTFKRGTCSLTGKCSTSLRFG